MLPSKPIKLDYEAVCESICSKYKNNLDDSILSFFIDFDNTPRYNKRARYFSNFSFEIFKNTLNTILSNDSFENIYVINTWNEWGEGMYLEPDLHTGFLKLQIIKETLSKYNT